jgi:hypothetical protein
MRSISRPEIYFAGHRAQPVDESRNCVRMAAFTAVITGAHAAESLGDATNRRKSRWTSPIWARASRSVATTPSASTTSLTTALYGHNRPATQPDLSPKLDRTQAAASSSLPRR